VARQVIAALTAWLFITVLSTVVVCAMSGALATPFLAVTFIVTGVLFSPLLASKRPQVCGLGFLPAKSHPPIL
jgi:hypothetical protein